MTILILLLGGAIAPECTERERFREVQLNFMIGELQHYSPAKNGLKDAVFDLWRQLVKKRRPTGIDLNIFSSRKSKKLNRRKRVSDPRKMQNER